MELIKDNDTILVAMSGGVDSSVTALLLKNAGYHVKGAILRMHDANMSPEDLINGKLPASIWYAREAARKMRLDFNIIDIRDLFREKVESYFVSAYEQGLTPNPCVYCNAAVKFQQMIQAADNLGCSKVASGHYANIEFREETGRYAVRKGKDHKKDQSYMLYRLSQEQLSRLIMPLGNYEKEEIRKIAEDAKLKNAKLPDSQDVCFIPDGDYGIFIENYIRNNPDSPENSMEMPGLIPGEFTDRSGHVLGTHKGLIHYTVGQRKGLGLSLKEPLYVCEKRTDTNQVVLGSNEDLMQDVVRAGDVNFVSVPEFENNKTMRITGKVRYSNQETPGEARMLPDGTLEVHFDTPVRAPAPGQSLVLYDGDLLIAGGIIL